MHEISLCRNILQLVQESSNREAFSVVNSICLGVGELVSVELESMRFGFDIVTRGTLAENAELNIVVIPGTARCGNCARQVSIKERFSACPCCGSFQLEILTGDELLIKELEVA